MSERTFTDVELQAAVDRAVADATSVVKQKEELDAALATAKTASDAALAAAQEEAATQIKDLQTRLDAAVLEASTERDKFVALETAQREAAELATKEAEIAARRDERLGKVREVANFPDEYLEQNGDRFAEMADEDFTKALADWAAIAVRTDRPPADSALRASRDTAIKSGSVLHEVLNLRAQGVDPRKI